MFPSHLNIWFSAVSGEVVTLLHGGLILVNRGWPIGCNVTSDPSALISIEKFIIPTKFIDLVPGGQPFALWEASNSVLTSDDMRPDDRSVILSVFLECVVAPGYWRVEV